jgi:hypothetical protein
MKLMLNLLYLYVQLSSLPRRFSASRSLGLADDLFRKAQPKFPLPCSPKPLHDHRSIFGGAKKVSLRAPWSEREHVRLKSGDGRLRSNLEPM